MESITSTITMTMCLLMTPILLSPFVRAYDLKRLGRDIIGNTAAYKEFFAEGMSSIGAGYEGGLKPVPNNNGVYATEVDVSQIPALETIGMCVALVDISPNALTSLHSHPQSSEVITVIEGTVYAAFLVPDPSNVAKSHVVGKMLNPGNVFAIPQGLLHYQRNVNAANLTAKLIQTFNSPSYVTVTVPSSIFANDSGIQDDLLAQFFRLDKSVVADLQKKFSS